MKQGYPKILTSLSGEEINNVSDWEGFRRQEIINLFETYVYGIRPEERPDDLSFEVESIDYDFKGTGIIRKIVNISFYGYSFPIKVFVPNSEKKPVPACVYIMHEYQTECHDLDNDVNASVVPILNITKRGYAVAVMTTINVAYDFEHHDEHKSGVFSAFSSKRNDSSWATISAWAWGASRVMDYLETDCDIDKNRIGVVGHSRSGKASLWCGATDTRFSFVISNNSGGTGSAMTRGKDGEKIKDINITDWLCKNYQKYNEREEMLPVDQHMLLSLIAPRLLYVASASLDDWADPASELKSCKLASEAYELYGIKGLVLSGEPKNNTPYHEGNIAYHVREGDHKICEYDWDLFLDFIDKNMKVQ